MGEHDELEAICDKMVHDMEAVAADIRKLNPSKNNPLFRLAANLEWSSNQYLRAKDAQRKAAEPVQCTGQHEFGCVECAIEREVKWHLANKATP